MEDRLTQFRSVFEARRVDYVGQFSKSIECASEFRPAYFELDIPNGRFAYFEGYASSNKVAGVCAADLVKYRHIYGVAVCHIHNSLLEVEHFTDAARSGIDNFVSRVTCADPAIMDRR